MPPNYVLQRIQPSLVPHLMRQTSSYLLTCMAVLDRLNELFAQTLSAKRALEKFVVPRGG